MKMFMATGSTLPARLEPLADPGGICISATVHEHVRAKLAYPFEDRGESDAQEYYQHQCGSMRLGRRKSQSLPRSEPRSS